MTDAIQVITTTGSREEADAIARALVTRRLAACVQVAGPVKSTYHWQGKIESDEEWVCVIKTLGSRYAELEAAIREVHSYDVPEILATDVAAGGADYLRWLASALDHGPERRTV